MEASDWGFGKHDAPTSAGQEIWVGSNIVYASDSQSGVPRPPGVLKLTGGGHEKKIKIMTGKQPDYILIVGLN